MTKKVGVKILYGTVALLFLLGCMLVYRQISEEEKKPVDILFLGDSLIGQVRDETSVPYLVGEKLGMSTYNGALGGTCAARVRSTEDEYFQMDGMCLATLSYALAEGDFRVPQATVIRQVATEHFPEVIDALERIDMDEVEYLVLEYGTNDYFGGRPSENPEEPWDEYTFAGAYRSTLERLTKAYPGLKILLLSPTFNWNVLTAENCETAEYGGGYLKEYVDIIEDLAAEYGVGYLDFYTGFYADRSYDAAGIYTADGIHLNPASRERMAQAIADYISDDKE